MSRQVQDPITIFSSDAVLQADFTASASTDYITSAAHGLSNGDCIWVSSTTTLPTGLSASTNYYVINKTTNTFQVSTVPNGSKVDITGAGTGTHTYALKGKAIQVTDFKTCVFSVNFASSPSMTIKFQGSSQLESVDLNAAQSATNLWDYIEVVDLEDGSAIDGDSGVTASEAATMSYEANVNGLNWVTVTVTAWSAGTLKVVLTAYSNE